MLQLSKDPDLLEALLAAKASPSPDARLGSMVFTLRHHDPGGIHLLIAEMSPAARAPFWIELAEVSMDARHIDAGIAAISGYSPMEVEEVKTASAQDLTAHLLILRACAQKEWDKARNLAKQIQHTFSQLRCLATIARHSQLTEDAEAVEARRRELQDGIQEEEDPHGFVRSDIDTVANFKPIDQTERLEKRLARLRRLLDVILPLDLFIGCEACLVVEAGGFNKLLELIEERNSSEAERAFYSAALAIGYAEQGEIDKARSYAERTTEHAELRSRAFTAIYLAKLKLTSAQRS